MKGLSPEEESKRMRLYKQGLTDRKIAEIFGYRRGRVQQWRYARGLPSNSSVSVPMEEALTAEQCKVMWRFLNHLLVAHSMNPDLDVGGFMAEYRKINWEVSA